MLTPLRIATAVAAAVVSSGVVFCVAWTAGFMVLWGCVYGDNLGGRWQWFVWPVAVEWAASAAAAALLLGIGKRITPAVAAVWVGLLLARSATWLLVVARLVMPPL